MKKIKLLMPIIGVTTILGSAATLASCGCSPKETTYEVEITGEAKESHQIIDGNLVIVLTSKTSGKVVTKVNEVKIGDKAVTYTFDMPTQKVTIEKAVLEKNSGKVSIKVTVGDTEQSISYEEWMALWKQIDDNFQNNCWMRPTVSQVKMLKVNGEVKTPTATSIRIFKLGKISSIKYGDGENDSIDIAGSTFLKKTIESQVIKNGGTFKHNVLDGSISYANQNVTSGQYAELSFDANGFVTNSKKITDSDPETLVCQLTGLTQAPTFKFDLPTGVNAYIVDKINTYSGNYQITFNGFVSTTHNDPVIKMNGSVLTTDDYAFDATEGIIQFNKGKTVESKIQDTDVFEIKITTK